jgi:cytochrome c biogenesis protein CcmG/thiol:disulfide interchange protein DsbE
MSRPRERKAGERRPRRGIPRPWPFVLGGIGLFLAGGLVGTILTVSVTLYNAPPDLTLPPPTPTGSSASLPPLAPSAQTAPSTSPSSTKPPTPTVVPVGPAVGQQAPPFTLPDLTGTAHDLQAHRGQFVVVSFWASWCPACHREWPVLQAIAERFAPEGVVVLAVNVGEPLEVVHQFVGDEGVPSTVLLDGDGRVSEDFRVTTLPTTFLLDPAGIVGQVIPGHVDTASLERFFQHDATGDQYKPAGEGAAEAVP